MQKTLQPTPAPPVGTLDSYLQLHAGTSVQTTLAQERPSRDSSRDPPVPQAMVDLGKENSYLGVNDSSTHLSIQMGGSFDQSSHELLQVQTSGCAQRPMPRRELQATNQADLKAGDTSTRRRDRPPSVTPKKPLPATSSKPRQASKSPAYAPAAGNNHHRGKVVTMASKAAPTRTASQARLADLCPEDKSKIGDLVKKLASESKARQESVNKFESEKSDFEQRLKKMQEEAAQMQQERDRIKEKLQQSMGLLSEMKETHTSVERERVDQAQELHKVRMELVESKRRQQTDSEETAKYRRELDRVSQERSVKESELMNTIREKESLLESQRQMLTERSRSSSRLQTISQVSQEKATPEVKKQTEDPGTLNQISDLKNEIAKLTESLSCFASFTKSVQQQQSQAQLASVASANMLQRSQGSTDDLVGGSAKPIKVQNIYQPSEDNDPASTFERMDLDELHSVQEQLKRQIQTTNTLIESKSRGASSFRSSISHNEQSTKGKFFSNNLTQKLPTALGSNMKRHSRESSGSPLKHKPTREIVEQSEHSQLSRIQSKAQQELDSYFVNSDDDGAATTPQQYLDIIPQKQPRIEAEDSNQSRVDTEAELLRQKLEVFQQIKSRFEAPISQQMERPTHQPVGGPDDSFQNNHNFDSHAQPSRKQMIGNLNETQKSVTDHMQDTPSFYKQLIQQQSSVLQQQQRMTQPTTQQSPMTSFSMHNGSFPATNLTSIQNNSSHHMNADIQCVKQSPHMPVRHQQLHHQPQSHPQKQDDEDSDDDLAYLLNSKRPAKQQPVAQSNNPMLAQAARVAHEKQSQMQNDQSMHSQQDFNESLFTIIDEIEHDQQMSQFTVTPSARSQYQQQSLSQQPVPQPQGYQTLQHQPGMSPMMAGQQATSASQMQMHPQQQMMTNNMMGQPGQQVFYTNQQSNQMMSHPQLQQMQQQMQVTQPQMQTLPSHSQVQNMNPYLAAALRERRLHQTMNNQFQ